MLLVQLVGRFVGWSNIFRLLAFIASLPLSDWSAMFMALLNNMIKMYTSINISKSYIKMLKNR